MAKQKPRKHRHFMLVQQLAHAQNFQTPADVEQLILGMATVPEKYGVILHDRDVLPDGSTKPLHIHASMSFKNPRSVSGLAKELGVPVQNIEIWRGDWRNAYAYLCHRTEKARKSKALYDPAEVIANFDYAAALEEWERGAVSGRKSTSIASMLDLFYKGDMSRDDIEAVLSGSQLAQALPKLDRLEKAKAEQEAKKWREEWVKSGKQVEAIWIYGRAGTGKTSLAKEIAKKTGKSVFISGSSRGLFDAYKGEQVVIIEEFAPAELPYSDIKRLLDPYAADRRAPARYADKPLQVELFIFTTPHDPLSFYRAQDTLVGDAFGQLARRLTLVLSADDTQVTPMLYNQVRGWYEVDPSNAPWPNRFSQAARAAQVGAVPSSSIYERVSEVLC